MITPMLWAPKKLVGIAEIEATLLGATVILIACREI
jgi:hypothetical protein